MTSVDWSAISSSLDAFGYALVPECLSRDECKALVKLYEDDALFRSRVVMARHGYGGGEYKYFAYPLPKIVARFRTTLYPHLASIANGWNESLKSDIRFPTTHAEFLERCHAAGQVRPTPLLLRYGEGDIIACIRTCMASMSFRCRLRSCFRSRKRISPAANSC
jgi:hypothetical protein